MDRCWPRFQVRVPYALILTLLSCKIQEPIRFLKISSLHLWSEHPQLSRIQLEHKEWLAPHILRREMNVPKPSHHPCRSLPGTSIIACGSLWSSFPTSMLIKVGTNTYQAQVYFIDLQSEEGTVYSHPSVGKIQLSWESLFHHSFFPFLLPSYNRLDARQRQVAHDSSIYPITLHPRLSNYILTT